MPLPLRSAEIRAILLDIEGTTTPVDFVFSTLFPFASARAEDFLRQHIHESDIAEIVGQLRRACEADLANGAPVWADATKEENIASAARYVNWLIARDSKITPLKTIQGKIWEEGFLSGELKGEVYADVAPAFARWKAQRRSIAIFSSGSALAQRLLFSHSVAGDLSRFIEQYFDTTIGSKRDAQSYRKIAASLRLQPSTMLFVSDVGEELDEASSIGMRTAHSLRPGIASLQDDRHSAIRSFDELFPSGEMASE